MGLWERTICIVVILVLLSIFPASGEAVSAIDMTREKYGIEGEHFSVYEGTPYRERINEECIGAYNDRIDACVAANDWGCYSEVAENKQPVYDCANAIWQEWADAMEAREVAVVSELNEAVDQIEGHLADCGGDGGCCTELTREHRIIMGQYAYVATLLSEARCFTPQPSDNMGLPIAGNVLPRPFEDWDCWTRTKDELLVLFWDGQTLDELEEDFQARCLAATPKETPLQEDAIEPTETPGTTILQTTAPPVRAEEEALPEPSGEEPDLGLMLANCLIFDLLEIEDELCSFIMEPEPAEAVPPHQDIPPEVEGSYYEGPQEVSLVPVKPAVIQRHPEPHYSISGDILREFGEDIEGVGDYIGLDTLRGLGRDIGRLGGALRDLEEYVGSAVDRGSRWIGAHVESLLDSGLDDVFGIHQEAPESYETPIGDSISAVGRPIQSFGGWIRRGEEWIIRPIIRLQNMIPLLPDVPEDDVPISIGDAISTLGSAVDAVGRGVGYVEGAISSAADSAWRGIGRGMDFVASRGLRLFFGHQDRDVVDAGDPGGWFGGLFS